jgi:glyoxylase-like metal-dependent hydrolase (beta-lactamase superfamily II)
VFRKRFEPCDVTVCAVVGADGVAVVDTRCSIAEAREFEDEIRRLTQARVRWVVNTHAHFDHTWGNAQFLAPRQEPPARIWGHETLPEKLDRRDPALAALLEELAAYSPAWAARVDALELAPPTELVGASASIDLGGRLLELRHHGRGHTDGDLWIRIPDAAVVLSGDLVEQCGPPSYGPDSYPLEWAATLGNALEWLGSAVVVPGHGEPVDRAFVIAQRDLIEAIGHEIKRLRAAGVEAADATAEGVWPVPAESLKHAVARGYAALG